MALAMASLICAESSLRPSASRPELRASYMTLGEWMTPGVCAIATVVIKPVAMRKSAILRLAISISLLSQVSDMALTCRVDFFRDEQRSQKIAQNRVLYQSATMLSVSAEISGAVAVRGPLVIEESSFCQPFETPLLPA